MKKTRKARKPQFTYRSIHRADKIKRWTLTAGIIFCALVLVSFIKIDNAENEAEILHSSASENIIPIHLESQASFVPEEITVDFDFAPESVEVVEFFANPKWKEISRTESEGKLQVALQLNDKNVERDFGAIYLRTISENIVKYEITERSGETFLTTGFDKFIGR